jgi:Flp pilus assembly protein TadB
MIDPKPASRVVRARNTKSVRRSSGVSLSEWCTETARDFRSGSSIHDIVNNDFPVALRGRGTSAERLQRSLASTDDPDERLILWATYSVLVFGIPAGATFDRTADRLRMREQLRFERVLHAAPARLSARSLTALPIAILLLLVVTSDDVRTFIRTPIGMLIVFVGCVLNEFGRRAMRAVIEPSNRRRRSSLSQDLTDTLEGIALAVMAGVPLRTVLMSSSTVVTGTLRPIFEQMAVDLADGALLADVLELLSHNVGERDQRVILSIIEGQRNGSPMSQTLSNLVNNIDRRREREEAHYVRTLPVRLAGPLVGLTLPAFVCLAILPPLASSLAGLSTSPLSSI